MSVFDWLVGFSAGVFTTHLHEIYSLNLSLPKESDGDSSGATPSYHQMEVVPQVLPSHQNTAEIGDDDDDDDGGGLIPWRPSWKIIPGKCQDSLGIHINVYTYCIYDVCIFLTMICYFLFRRYRCRSGLWDPSEPHRQSSTPRGLALQPTRSCDFSFSN